MTRRRTCILIAVSLMVASRAAGQTPALWSDLPKQAASWPPAWAALVRDVDPARVDFGKDVAQRVDKLLRDGATKEAYRLADTVLSAAIRHQQSKGVGAPLETTKSSTSDLMDSLSSARKDWLTHLQQNGEQAEALRLAESWLPSASDSLQSAIQKLWIEQAKAALAKQDFAVVRSWVDRLEERFADGALLNEIRIPLQDRALALQKQSQEKADAAAIRDLEEALALSPRLPGARDDLERRKGTYRTLVVGVRSLPTQLSPATAWTEVEKQSLELLFDRLYQFEQQPGLGKRYRPQLATVLPDRGLMASTMLRSNAYWSSGERVTPADIRHTALLMNQTEAIGRSTLWRDYLEIPRVTGNPRQINISFHQGLFDPVAPLTFWVLPQNYHGKQLPRGDNAEFAKAPVGSGPFQYLGRKTDAGKAYAHFQANPYDLRLGANPLREIRMVTWADARKDLAKPVPQLILDAPTDQLPALKELGYAEVEAARSSAVYFLAVNHRKRSLANVAIRQAIALAINRQALLDRHFRGSSPKGKHHATANGLFPRDSWANAPAPRVPAELYDIAKAASLARKIKGDSAKVEWTLKYPSGEARVKAACDEMVFAIASLFEEAGVKADIVAHGLPPAALHKAIYEHDYDLLYTSVEGLDDPVRLAMFFDRQEESTRPGGSNVLGYDKDLKLHELIGVVLQHRQFSAVQTSMQAVHVHLSDTMPAIPLWQLDTHVLVLPTLRTPPLDPRAVFANVRQWKIEK